MAFSPIYQELSGFLWYLIPFFTIVGLFKSPWFKGKVGEFLVNLLARLFLDKSRYHLIKNVTLPTEDGTTQIDHVLVSEFGVFVVETKNMKGWIFGSPHQRFWTQKIFRSNYKFQNPLHQNYKHVKTLQALLGFGDHQMHSVVVFVGDSSFKTSMPDNVTRGLGYLRYIKSKQEAVLSPLQVAEAVEKVASGRLKESFSTDRDHVRHVKGLVAERYGDSGRRRRGGLLGILVFPAMMFGIGAVVLNAYSDFVTGAKAIGTSNMPEQLVEGNRQSAPLQPEAQPKAEVRTAVARSDSSQSCSALISRHPRLTWRSRNATH